MLDTIALANDTLAAVQSVVIDTTFVIKHSVPADAPTKVFTIANVTEILLAALVLMKVVANLTPTEKDNKVFGVIDAVINYFIPDRKLKQ
jgi:hypothetical protein